MLYWEEEEAYRRLHSIDCGTLISLYRRKIGMRQLTQRCAGDSIAHVPASAFPPRAEAHVDQKPS